MKWICRDRDCQFNLCYKCARSKHLVHPGHDFEATGPEYFEANEPSQTVDDEDEAEAELHVDSEDSVEDDDDEDGCEEEFIDDNDSDVLSNVG